MKVFLATNELISALMANGHCADLMRIALAKHELLVGEVNLVEMRRVLVKRFAASPQQIDRAEKLLRDQTLVPRPSAPAQIPIRDADDAWVMASALDGGADILVTGDMDLLAVSTEVTLSILTPRAAWEQLQR